MNILGIDYGLKNVGFAIGEQITNSCSTYFSMKFRNRKELIEKIKNLITEWDINTIVIGLPLNMDNSESEMSLEIRNFSRKLEKDINIKINFVDEKLTTFEAKQIMKDLNKNKKELIEKIKNLITEWDINTIVIGLPLNMDNSESEMSLEIRNFSKKLEKDINIKINFVDEKLTTFEAKQIMKDLNKNKKEIKRNNHGLAAKLIVDSFLREKK